MARRRPISKPATILSPASRYPSPRTTGSPYSTARPADSENRALSAVAVRSRRSSTTLPRANASSSPTNSARSASISLVSTPPAAPRPDGRVMRGRSVAVVRAPAKGVRVKVTRGPARVARLARRTSRTFPSATTASRAPMKVRRSASRVRVVSRYRTLPIITASSWTCRHTALSPVISASPQVTVTGPPRYAVIAPSRSGSGRSTRGPARPMLSAQRLTPCAPSPPPGPKDGTRTIAASGTSARTACAALTAAP
jgi:hypothetical protein